MVQLPYHGIETEQPLLYYNVNLKLFPVTLLLNIARCLQGLLKIAKGEKSVRLLFLDRAGPPDDRLVLRKIDFIQFLTCPIRMVNYWS